MSLIVIHRDNGVIAARAQLDEDRVTRHRTDHRVTACHIPFTAFTNDLAIGRTLSARAAIHTFMAGGYIRPASTTVLGSDALQSIARLKADIAFIGTHAMTADDLSDTSIELAEFKRAILLAARRVVLLVDSSKIFSRAFCSFGRTTDVGMIITDDRISAAALAELRARGIPVELVAGNAE